MTNFTIVDNNNTNVSKKMTARDFFTGILACEIPQNLRNYAEAEIEKMNARNKKRSESLSPAQKENLLLMEKIRNILTTEPKLTTDIATETNLSTPKASSLLLKLVDNGIARAIDVRVKGKGIQKAYYIADNIDNICENESEN